MAIFEHVLRDLRTDPTAKFRRASWYEGMYIFGEYTQTGKLVKVRLHRVDGRDTTFCGGPYLVDGDLLADDWEALQ